MSCEERRWYINNHRYDEAQDVKRTEDDIVDMNDRIIIRILVSSCLSIAQFKIR